MVAPPGAPGAVCVDLASVVRVPIRRVAVRAMRVPDDVELYCILKCVCAWCCAFKITTCRGLGWSFQMKNVFRSIASRST